MILGRIGMRPALGRLAWAAGAMALTLLLAYALLSRGGLVSVNAGVDWAHHAALTDVLTLGEDVEARRVQLGEFSDHPRLAHRVAALMARATGLSPLRTLHIVATAAVIACVVLAAARVAFVAFAAGTGLGALLGALAGILMLWAANAIAAGFAGEIQYNYFFSQAAATALALGLLTLVQLSVAMGGRRAAVALVLAPPAAYLLAAVHTAPALWFAASASICALSLETSRRGRLVAALTLGAVSAVMILAHPGTLALMRLGQEGGGDLNLLPFGRIWQLNLNLGSMLAGMLALAALLALLAFLKRRATPEWLPAVLNVHCGALGLLAVSLPILANLLVSANQGYYALAKYVYIFGAEAALLVAHLAAQVRSARPDTPLRSGAMLAVFALAVLAQDWWSLRWSHSQAYLMGLRDDLMQVRGAIPAPAPWPLLEPLSQAERFYVFISAMARPRDGEAFPLLFDADLAAKPGSDARLLPASLVPSVAPLWSGNEIRFTTSAHYPPPVLISGRWGPPTALGRWTTGPRAQMALRIPPAMQDARLCVRLLAPALDPRKALQSKLFVNGQPAHIEAFPNPPGARVAGLPLTSVGPSGDVALSLVNEFSPAAPDDDRQTGAGIAAIWIARQCS